MESRLLDGYLIDSQIPSYRDDLVKESDWINISDPYLGKKFQVIWEDHVDGFKKRKIKNPKDKDMEWRKRLEEKQKNPLYVSDVTRDEIANRFKHLSKQKGTCVTLIFLCSLLATVETETSSCSAPNAMKSTPNLSAWRGTAGGGGKFLTEKETAPHQQPQKPRNLILNSVFGQEDDYEKKLESSELMPYRKANNRAKPAEKSQVITNPTNNKAIEVSAAPKPTQPATVGPKVAYQHCF